MFSLGFLFNKIPKLKSKTTVYSLKKKEQILAIFVRVELWKIASDINSIYSYENLT